MTNDPPFKLHALSERIEAERKRQKLSWTELSRQVGVSVSTIRRFRIADDAEADGVLALVRWLDLEPELFCAHSVRGEKLPRSSAAIVRVDTTKIAEALNEPAIAKRNRLTIQRLAGAAHTGRCSIASLTRLSDI